MNTKLYKFSIITLILFFCSCSTFVNQEELKPENKKWVYLEILNIMKGDSTNYYLYGKINNSILTKINKNEKSSGLFKFSEIRFINDDDLFEIYEDENDSGDLYFRIENIKKISVYKRDPIYTFKDNKLHKSTLKIKLNSKQK